MKNLFNLDFKSALKRIFAGEKKEQRTADTVVSAEKLNERVLETEAPVMLTIWTIERSRYEAARALCTDIEVYPSEAITLSEDIVGYVLGTPNGETVVVEARTGGLVGHSIEIVLDGIREMTKVQLNNQLDTARKEFNRMSKHELPNDEFWKAIKMGGAEIEASQDY